MSSIVIALPKIEDAKKIRAVLERQYVQLHQMLCQVRLNLEVVC